MHRPGDEAGLRASEPDHHAGDLLRATVSLDRHEAVQNLAHRTGGRVGIGIDRAGLHHVAREPARAEVERKAARQALQGGLAHRIGRHAGDRHPVTVDRADDDDPSAFGHAPRRLHGRVVGRMDIDAEQAVDGIGVLLERIAEDGDTGIDHQHVERAALAHPGDERSAIRAVRLDRRAAGFGGELRGGLVRAGIGEANARSLGGEALHYCRPDAATAAEHQHGLSLKRRDGDSLRYCVGLATLPSQAAPSRLCVMKTTKSLRPRGRPRQFDPDDAVATAQRLFHERGYDAVSVADLTAALGIRPPSFYAAFGSKAGLYERVLERYNATGAIPLAELLDPERPVAEGLAAV